jgi:TolA-binding protein
MRKVACFLILAMFVSPVLSAEPESSYRTAIENYKKGFYRLTRPGEDPHAFLNKAQQQFELIIANYPNSDEAANSLLKLGYCQSKLGNQTTATETFNSYLSQYGASTNSMIDDAKLQLAIAYRLNSDQAHAEKFLLETISYKTSTIPDQKNAIPDAYYELWSLYRDQNMTVEASAVATEFITAYPDHPQAVYVSRQ